MQVIILCGGQGTRIRDVTEKDLEWKRMATRDYMRLPPAYHAGLKPAEPLRAAEANRKRNYACESLPKHTMR